MAVVAFLFAAVSRGGRSRSSKGSRARDSVPGPGGSPLLRTAHRAPLTPPMFGAGPEPEPGSWGAVRGQRLPEILTLEEFRRMLAVAYHADSRNGLVLRLLFETAVQVSELSRLDVPDIELASAPLGSVTVQRPRTGWCCLRRTSSSCCRCTSGVRHSSPKDFSWQLRLGRKRRGEESERHDDDHDWPWNPQASRRSRSDSSA